MAGREALGSMTDAQSRLVQVHLHDAQPLPELSCNKTMSLAFWKSALCHHYKYNAELYVTKCYQVAFSLCILLKTPPDPHANLYYTVYAALVIRSHVKVKDRGLSLTLSYFNNKETTCKSRTCRYSQYMLSHQLISQSTHFSASCAPLTWLEYASSRSD